MMNKKKPQSSLTDDQLVQMDLGTEEDIFEDTKLQTKSRTRMTLKDDIDVAAVDDIMKKYDQNEKVEKQNEEFVSVLQKDDKLKSFFLDNYTPGYNEQDDQKFVSYTFSKYSEQGWGEDGQPLEKQVLSKKKAKKFAEDVVSKWKGYDVDYSAEVDPKKAEAEADKFLASGKRFETAWRKYDHSKAQAGNIDMMEAHSFIQKIIPKEDISASSAAES